MIKTIFRTFLLGLGVGVLVAPRPGSETRQMLSERFGRLFNAENNTSAAEWDRPLGDALGSDMTPSQHYTATTPAPSAYNDAAARSSIDTRMADSDIAGASDI